MKRALMMLAAAATLAGCGKTAEPSPEFLAACVHGPDDMRSSLSAGEIVRVISANTGDPLFWEAGDRDGVFILRRVQKNALTGEVHEYGFEFADKGAVKDPLAEGCGPGAVRLTRVSGDGVDYGPGGAAQTLAIWIQQILPQRGG